MARTTQREMDHDSPRLGELSPQYRFFLNLYTDVRFTTSCSGCQGKTGLRKKPLAIHVDDWGMVILNKTCRFCSYCDLLIAHRDELEAHLARLFAERALERIGKDYLVVGTIERRAWRRGLDVPPAVAQLFAALHDFKDTLHFEPELRWVYTGSGEHPSILRSR